MIRSSFAATLLIASTVLAAPRHRSVELPNEFTFVDAIAQQALASGNPGISIAIEEGDKTLFAKAYGFEDLSAQLASTPATIYEIGSITKQFTAAAIMRLVESGQLRVDDKAAMFVPELGAAYAGVTIDQLLTHTSGIRDYIQLLTTAWEPKSESEILALINSRPLLFAPGTNWSYSNSNYYIVGMVIERITGDSFPHYLEQHFFLPLGLTSTSYCNAPLPSGYVRQSGVTGRVQSADMSLLFAAGAICSTAIDLVHWNRALISGRAVSPESYWKMRTPATLKDGTIVPYGYALLIDSLDGHPRVWHNGAVLGYTSNLACYPEANVTISVLVNITELDQDLATEISDQIARALLK
jgi:D-alanyl-D-alanine carboxypeptidase